MNYRPRRHQHRLNGISLAPSERSHQQRNGETKIQHTIRGVPNTSLRDRMKLSRSLNGECGLLVGRSRRYLLWLRLQDAVRELAAGAPATDAAHAAGFADSAHLSRTFRRMFGITPSDLARSQFVQA